MDRDDNILNILLNKKFIQLLDQNDDDHNDVVENSFLLSKSAISYIDFDANVQTISYQKLLDYCRQIRKRLIESLELNDIKPIKILENVSIDNCEKISIKIPQTLVIYGDCGLWTPIFMLIANIMKLSFYYVSDQEILVKNIEQFKSLSLLTGILITHRYRSQELEQILNSSTDDEFIIDNIIDDFFIFLKKSSPIDNHHDDDIDKEFQSINISYLINTSGTTTSINRISNNTNNSNVVVSNKTIFVTHSSIQRNVIDFCNEFNLIADDIVLICSSFSLDPSICDMFLALSSFSHLIITDNSVRNVGENFAKIISEFEITYMTITPSLWYRINYYLLKIFQKSSSSSIHLRFVNFGGEICPNQNQLKIFQQYPIEFRNLYGLSEMSVWASMFKIDGISSVDQEIRNSYGIDSMMAVEITTSIEDLFSLYNEDIYPLLFTHTIDQLVDVIIHMIEIRKSNNKKQRTSKRYVDRIKSFDTIVSISNSSFRIEHLWSYFMEQCVDSSPLLIHLDDSMTTMIICTSHSGLINTFVENIEQKNYYSIRWSQRIANRIEANPIASSDCELVYVADYSGLIQAFDLKSGRIVWQSKTNDQIKCSPIIFADSSIGELILCGSYDHNLYCWQQSNGYIRWKIDVNQSPIFASPIVWYDQLGNKWFAVVCTLNGTIGCYHLIDGQQRWKYNHSNRPIFSTPKIFKDNLIVGMTDSRLISISLQNGLIIWELLLEKMPIFSSPCLVKQNDNDDDCRIIIGTNGCSIMCTKFNSKQPEWIFKTESNVYADIIYLTEFERLLAIETNGKIHLLNPNDGQSIPINGFDHFNAEIFSSPVYNVNRKTFLIGCRDSYVHCLSLKESV